MKPASLSTWAPTAVFLFIAGLAHPADQPPRVAIVVRENAPQLERFAASELCGYLVMLFHIHVAPTRRLLPSSQAVFLIGSPKTNSAVKRATVSRQFPNVSDQGIVLRKVEIGKSTGLIVGGGSPQATLWAFYELVERWGVRYLIERDAIPAKIGPFTLPELDVTMEPVFRVRAHPSIQDFADSGESWGAADFHRLIDQLAKMKFNRLHIYAFGWQPYLDWECKGTKRKSAWLWYGYHYPLSDPICRGRSCSGMSQNFGILISRSLLTVMLL